MKTSDNFIDRRQNIERRRRDRLIKIGQMIASELDFNTLFDVVVEQTNTIMETERCSIFLIDDKSEYLNAYVSLDLEKNFRLPKDQGVAGWVFCNEKTRISNAPYKDPLFSSTADKTSEFHTRNILCTPLLGRNKKCLGTMQVLNKGSGDFTYEDQEIIVFIAAYVSIAIENSMLYEEVRNSDIYKDKAISHLSHELKTPLSIIGAAFNRILKVTKENEDTKVTQPAIRGLNNVKRLMELQSIVEDIIAQRMTNVEQKYSALLENIKYFMEECGEDGASHSLDSIEELIEKITNRIAEILKVKELDPKKISLDEFLNKMCSNITSYCDERDITIARDIEKKISVFMDERILKTVFTGLLKNAIENTPDKGLIKVFALKRDDHIHVKVKDYGVGITKTNQKNIFKGLFHTQETRAYSSKRPYEFNAGGTGTDLLRIKVLAERLGFSIDCESTRCPFILTDDKVCPGKISLCQQINHIDECSSNGGSIFTLKFPDNIL